jgi:ABC-2 type transport system permease protein
VVVVAEIVGSVPQLEPVWPWLFSRDWLSFADLLRTPMYWAEVRHMLLVQVGYMAVLGSWGWARFTVRDLAG